MEWLTDSAMLEFGFGLLIVGSVLYRIHADLVALITYLSVHEGDSYRVTFVGRRIAQVHYGLFIVSAGFTAAFMNGLWNSPVILVALCTMMVGFMIEALLFRICLVTEEGLGLVGGADRVEIAWSEIDSFLWTDNRLTLTLKSKRRQTFRFYDTSIIVFINDHLKTLFQPSS